MAINENFTMIIIEPADKQIDGAPMGSSPSPLIVNLFMIYLESEKLNKATLISGGTTWKIHYLSTELEYFLVFMNSINYKAQFSLIKKTTFHYS